MAAIVRQLRLINGGSGEVAARGRGGDGPRLRVAIASRDGKGLNAHFGFAEKLMVYEVARRTSRLVQAVTFVSDDSRPDEPESEDKIGPKVAALAGCHLLFVLAIGPPAAAKVIQANIHPIKVAAPEAIDTVISRVQTMMNGLPPPWLRKVMDQSATSPRHPPTR